MTGWILLVAALACLVANGVLIRRLGRQQRELGALGDQVAGAVRAQRELELRRAELIEKQRVAEQLVEHGSIGVETVHRAVAGLTFGILHNIPATSPGARAVRDVHDKVSGESYEAVRRLNRQVGSFLKEMLEPGKPE